MRCEGIRRLNPSIALLVWAQSSGAGPSLDQSWSAPVNFDPKWDCRPFLSVQKWNGSVVVFGFETKGHGAINHAAYFLQESGTNWVKKPISGLSGWFTAAADPESTMVIFLKSEILPSRTEVIRTKDFSQDRVEAEVVCASANSASEIEIRSTVKVPLTKADLFGQTTTNVGLSTFGFGAATFRGSQIWVPYVVTSEIWRGNEITVSEGLTRMGMLHSRDGGVSWSRSNLFDFQGPSFTCGVFATKRTWYFLGDKNPAEFWSATRGEEATAWSKPGTMVSKFRFAGYVATSENDTFHLCWLDRREQSLLDSLRFEAIANDQVFYRNRTDSTGSWSAEKKLSVGLKRAGGMAMSVEGQKIVVAWHCYNPKAGAITSDIYYCVSSDAGRTWSRPMQVTDTKYDMGARSPRVMLHRNTIHLFYNQGRQNYHGNCWDILYQRREFPR